MVNFSFIFICYFLTTICSLVEINVSAVSYKKIDFSGKLNKKCKGPIKKTLILCKYSFSFSIFFSIARYKKILNEKKLISYLTNRQDKRIVC